ncbi:MAG: DUF655 domain-containing protein, partial [Candidatus Bathyarchaeia archaeon]
AGLVPSTHSSGGVTRHGRITKEGSRWLRWAMVEAALVHLRYDTPVTRFYRRVAERRGSKTARVAAGRKLLTVCYSVLKNQRPYYNPLEVQPKKDAVYEIRDRIYLGREKRDRVSRVLGRISYEELISSARAR